MTQSSSIIVPSILFTLICVAFLKLKSTKNRSDCSDADKQVTEPHEIDVAAIPLTFPWEPSSDCLPQQQQEVNKRRHNTADKSQKEQLEFLASMTFAGGGLRAPSCPCCR